MARARHLSFGAAAGPRTAPGAQPCPSSAEGGIARLAQTPCHRTSRSGQCVGSLRILLRVNAPGWRRLPQPLPALRSCCHAPVRQQKQEFATRNPACAPKCPLPSCLGQRSAGCSQAPLLCSPLRALPKSTLRATRWLPGCPPRLQPRRARRAVSRGSGASSATKRLCQDRARDRGRWQHFVEASGAPLALLPCAAGAADGSDIASTEVQNMMLKSQIEALKVQLGETGEYIRGQPATLAEPVLPAPGWPPGRRAFGCECALRSIAQRRGGGGHQGVEIARLETTTAAAEATTAPRGAASRASPSLPQPTGLPRRCELRKRSGPSRLWSQT